MEENLDKALSTALQAATPQKELPSSIKASAPDMDNMGKAAFEYLREAKEHLRQGRWAEYGKAVENMEKILIKMSGTSGETRQP